MMRGAKGKERKQTRKGLAVAGFLFGILGLLGFWVPILGTLLTFLAIVFSKLALGAIKRDPKRNGGSVLATVGFALGVIFLVLSIVVLLIVGGIFFLGFIAGNVMGY